MKQQHYYIETCCEAIILLEMRVFIKLFGDFIQYDLGIHLAVLGIHES
jgi:hypothetical protein